MTEIKTTTWLEDELATQTTHTDYEELPSLKLQPNVVTDIAIDFSNPFQLWTGEQNGKTITKKIIPVVVNGSKMNWWLNIKNPAYKDIIHAGRTGQKTFKILQTGKQDKTKYVILK